MLLYMSATATYNLPPGLLRAVCYTESHHNVRAIHFDDGSGTSLGTCQVQLESAREMGFDGSEKELMEPYNNVKYAGLYLRSRLRRNGNDVVLGVASYNAGSVIRKPNGDLINQAYVDKVMDAWAEGL